MARQYAFRAGRRSKMWPGDVDLMAERPRRRREDIDLSGRLAVVEAVQQMHTSLLQSVSKSLESLVRIESENAVARVQCASSAKDIDTIKGEMPSLRIVRMLVFTSALAVFGSTITLGWTIVRDAAQARQDRARILPASGTDVKVDSQHANQ